MGEEGETVATEDEEGAKKEGNDQEVDDDTICFEGLSLSNI